MNLMELGKDSMILSMLKEAGKVGSPSWSFWNGLETGVSGARMNGSLMLGCYDKAKIKGMKNHIGQLIPTLVCQSGMSVRASEVVMKFPHRSAQNLLPQSYMQTCLSTRSIFVISLPAGLQYSLFEALTITSSASRSSCGDFYTPSIPADDVFKGDRIIGLEPGLRLSVPNSQPVLSDRTTNSTTSELSTSTSARRVKIFPLPDESTGIMPILGHYFFSAALLMTNLENGSFTL